MGEIELILGCMFSGKSTELIRRIRRYKSIGKKVLSVNYLEDKRYGNNNIVTHDKIKEDALFVKNLQQIITHENFQSSEIIAINEGQFFSDLYNLVITFADYYNKNVIICGLDGDYKRQPFGDILKLIPHSESVIKLTALCKICNDGTKAAFTKRTSKSDDLILIGSEESYLPVCRKCYNIDNIERIGIEVAL